MRGWLITIGVLSTAYALSSWFGTEPTAGSSCVGSVRGSSLFLLALVLSAICAAMAAGLLRAGDMREYAGVRGGLVFAGVLMVLETVFHMFDVFAAYNVGSVPCSVALPQLSTQANLLQFIVAVVVAIVAFRAASRSA